MQDWQKLIHRQLRSLGVILLVLTLFFSGWGIQPAAALVKTEVKPETRIQPYLDRVEAEISEFQLENGLKFIVLEKHQAPVVSFMTYVNVGSAQEPDGKTGVAHFLEHLAFKGTTQIGTKDYAAEKQVLDEQDLIFKKIKQAKADPNRQAELKTLEAEFDQVQEKASTYVYPNQFGEIVEQAGGVGLNATTSNDATRFFYSFPSNKLELWMSLESERFLEPVFRDFFTEKNVILEERRTRTENSPVGQLFEMLLAKTFQRHPYGRPTIGSTEDLQQLERADVDAFFRQHYVPSNITIAIVGDVKAAEVKRLAKAYFGRYPRRPDPEMPLPVEPVQSQAQAFTLTLAAQPSYFQAYHIPAATHPDAVVYEVMDRVLSGGRTSRLYRSLVEQQQVALSADGSIGFPGDKYPNLMILNAQTAPGHTDAEVAAALNAELEKLKTEWVAPEELARVKKQVQVDSLESLDSNSGMASLLAEYQAKTGDWRNLFVELNRLAEVTAADIQRVAKATFVDSNRTVAQIVPMVEPNKTKL